jgi:nitrite reductase/ring-hydroxylating ferredoxin subunit/uncharacterized membrane protein
MRTRLSTRADDAIEQLADTPAVRTATEQAASVVSKVIKPGAVKDALSGTPVGHPVHPVLVQATIGMLLSANVLDLVGERRAARRLLGLGVLSAGPSIAAGWSDWSDTMGKEARVGVIHAVTNATGVSLCAASYVRRLRGKRGGPALAALGSTMLGLGGWLGGHLSYAYGVGVDTTAFQAGPSDWTDVGPATLTEGTPLQVDADGVPVLLIKQRGRVYALADRCTHRGGPLSEGTFSEGCVECPWHGSTFDLASGDVVRGPATRPQPRFAVRERDGRFEVRRDETRALRTNPVGAG